VQRRDFFNPSFAATTVLSLTYGYSIESLNHPIVKLVQELNHVTAREATPEKAALLDIFPFGKFHP